MNFILSNIEEICETLNSKKENKNKNKKERKHDFKNN